MPGLSTFTDFMAATGPAYLSSPDSVINEVQKQNYLLGEFFRGKDMEQIVQGGSKIRDVSLLGERNTFQHIKPNQPFSVSQPQQLKTLEANWRFSQDQKTWNEQQILLNDGDPKVVYKRYKRVLDQGMWTSMLNGLDSSLLASPYSMYTEMESADGTNPYTLHAFITEHILSTARGYMGGVPTGWTNVMGVNPSTTDRWSNQLTFYTPAASSPNSADVANGALTGHNAISAGGVRIFALLTGFDDMWSKLQWKSPGVKDEHFDQTIAGQQMILCSRLGINAYRQALRASNDQLLGGMSRSDASYQNPVYGGVALREVSEWNTAAVWPAAASAVTNTLAGRNGQTVTQGGSETQDITVDKGPRFMFLNRMYMSAVIHSEKFLTQDAPRQADLQHTWYQTCQCWWNLFCHSRQRQGLLAPVLAA